MTCICNSTTPSRTSCRSRRRGQHELAPPAGGVSPRSQDVVQLMDQIIALKSEPIERTGGRPAREYVHSYRLTTGSSAADKVAWKRGTIRSQLPHMLPPPYRRECVALETRLLAMCHADAADADDLAPITELRTLELDQLRDMLPGWESKTIEGRAPNAVDGYAAAVWDGKLQTVLISGGVSADGRSTNDIWMLSLGGVQLQHACAPTSARTRTRARSRATCSAQVCRHRCAGMNASVAAWRVLAEWPNSNFSGDGFSERSNHTLTHLPETSQFWIFEAGPKASCSTTCTLSTWRRSSGRRRSTSAATRPRPASTMPLALSPSATWW